MGWSVREQILIAGTSRMNSAWRNFCLRFERSLKTRRVAPKQKTDAALRIVASGTSTEALVSRYRELYGTDLYSVYIGSPQWPKSLFDFAAASNHAIDPNESPTASYYPGARLTAWMPGVFVPSIDRDVSRSAQPLILALIGGVNKAFRLDSSLISQQLQGLASRAENVTPLAVAFSRRTPWDLERHVRSSLDTRHTAFIDRNSRSAYLEATRHASEFAVTPDSITMICESLATSKPVTVLDLPCFNPDTSTFRFVSEVRTLTSTDAANVLQAASDRVLQMARSQHQKWLMR
jgi:mitochondrial fission protein ELM1